MGFFKRNETKPVFVNHLQIGGNENVIIQSMCNIKTSKTNEVLKQINQLYLAGCELVRVSILDDEDIESLSTIIKESPIPIVADIHFDSSFAIKAIKKGIKKIRLNPGNITDENRIKEICLLANENNVAIRIGVNSGSLPETNINEFGRSANSMIKTVEDYLKIFEKNNFRNIVISLKSEDPFLMIEAYEKISKLYDYPLHLGVTEAGMGMDGLIKSCVGLTPLLLKGIGNTIRISLTNDPIEEVYAAKKLLNVLKIRNDMVDIISCPTCGRLEYNMNQVVAEIKEYTKNINIPIKISILGCVVNGIGEGKNSDIGLAGNKEMCILFKKGKILKQIKASESIYELKKLIDEYIIEKNK